MRLHIIAEGQTEELFASMVLKPYLAQFGIEVYPNCIRNKKDKSQYQGGGFINYENLHKQLTIFSKSSGNNKDIRFTTMLDFYKFRIPEHYNAKFLEAIKSGSSLDKVMKLENVMREDIGDWRFIPYIQLHEFEALVLCEPQKIKEICIGSEKGIENLMLDIKGIEPEEINQGEETAPSKRIIKFVPEYENQKIWGALIAEENRYRKTKSPMSSF